MREMNIRIPTTNDRSKWKVRPHGKNIIAGFFTATSLLINQSACSLANASFNADNEEYDFASLDPDSPYGSPYGGFSRATAGRLASLPLRLPHVADKLDEFEPFFLHVMDVTGQFFSCRSYHEDELDPTTLDKGMFAPPILADKHMASTEIRIGENVVQTNANALMANTDTTTTFDDGIYDRLAQLHGMCAQMHQGWWSYEWCYEGRVTQFHVELEGLGNQDQILKVEDVTNLGDFRQRRLTSTKTKEATFIGQENEVIQQFVGGDICLETGKHRETLAHLRCCSPAPAAKNKGTVLYEGEPFETDLVYVQGVAESKKQMCTYTITICTPLLCDDTGSRRKKYHLAPPISLDGSHLHNEAQEVENLSISEILDMTFGIKRKKCVQFGTGAW